MAADPDKVGELDASDKGKGHVAGQSTAAVDTEDVDDPDFDDLDGKIEHTILLLLVQA